MKLLCVTIVECALIVVAFGMPQDTTYPTTYDDVNIDDILHNDRLFNRYFTCLTKKEGCTPEGKLLAATIPDALATSCAKCSAKQKTAAEKVIKYLYFNKRDKFDELAKIYDPESNYLNKYLVDGF